MNWSGILSLELSFLYILRSNSISITENSWFPLYIITAIFMHKLKYNPYSNFLISLDIWISLSARPKLPNDILFFFFGQIHVSIIFWTLSLITSISSFYKPTRFSLIPTTLLIMYSLASDDLAEFINNESLVSHIEILLLLGVFNN